MKKLNKIKKLFIFVIIFKRFKFLISKFSKFSLNGVKWLFNSKEHTNFTIELKDQNLEIFSETLSKIIDVEKNMIIDKITYLQNTKVILPANTKFYERIDLDIKPKWDYRFIPYFLITENKIDNIYEFGIDQGRLGYLLNTYIENELIKKINYTGIEYNKRKGVLLRNVQKKNFNLIYEKLETAIINLDRDNLQNSLIISSTHEKKSEEFLFNYFFDNEITPKYIISDETSSISPFRKFIEKKNYSYATFSFIDPNEILPTFYIGLAKLN